MEPIYSYEKGRGWVAQFHESTIITNSEKQRVRLELRKPTDGELYMNCDRP
jgi:hypothetical protein